MEIIMHIIDILLINWLEKVWARRSIEKGTDFPTAGQQWVKAMDSSNYCF